MSYAHHGTAMLLATAGMPAQRTSGPAGALSAASTLAASSPSSQSRSQLARPYRTTRRYGGLVTTRRTRSGRARAARASGVWGFQRWTISAKFNRAPRDATLRAGQDGCARNQGNLA